MLGSTLLAVASAALASAHTIITYPGWRGNNLITNETWPYGMQWMYPCGGMNTTNNRTYWPTTGGAIAFQPGWFQGHATALVYVNLGFGTDGPNQGPKNMSFPMVPPFQLLGPSKNPYPGTVCLPQVPLPAGANVQVGDMATIQLVELAVHGAALYSCVDIIFAAPGDPKIGKVNETNCFNSTDIGMAEMYTLTVRASGQGNITSGAERRVLRHSGSIFAYLGYLPLALSSLWILL